MKTSYASLWAPQLGSTKLTETHQPASRNIFKLLSATPSTYARKLRIAPAEKGLPSELLTKVPWNTTTTTPRYNPLEKLPVLLLPDGSSVYESSYILQYLELKHPQTPLLPNDINDELAARKVEVLGDGVCNAVVLLLFEKMRAGGGGLEWPTRQRLKIDGGVAEMAKISGSQRWASGNSFTLGDIAVGTAVGYLRVRFQELRRQMLYPGLASLSDRLEQRPSFKKRFRTHKSSPTSWCECYFLQRRIQICSATPIAVRAPSVAVALKLHSTPAQRLHLPGQLEVTELKHPRRGKVAWSGSSHH